MAILGDVRSQKTKKRGQLLCLKRTKTITKHQLLFGMFKMLLCIVLSGVSVFNELSGDHIQLLLD